MISTNDSDRLIPLPKAGEETQEQTPVSGQRKKVYVRPELVTYGKLSLGNVLKIVSL